ncbi:deoxyuridine 5'-triphosphate nucleotidohydrolase [Brevibacillus brevis]|uniref:dUTP diphosphatase n=1 Tax=Brevibacillus brevis TaxID=1393 RepID=UPI001901E14A|nr:dUTP diphosphatase [Brevibacillus brevis]MBH0331457.1 deoxyuridine 5'-triphosphate nucleotidohydrolase [Brevibacillus brevis]
MNTTEVNVKIKKLHSDAVVPQYARPMDAGFDLVAVEDVVILPGETAKIRTGLAFALPEGYELQVRNRSGVAAKTKLRVSNSPGTVDAGYRGEVSVIMDNISQLKQGMVAGEIVFVDGKDAIGREHDRGTYIIRKGDRIAQGVIAIVPIAQFEVVDELDETERGTGGFGISGVRA